ncbi:MAG: DNA polymerase III subunit gamma/tau [Pleurocapsa sp.]
MAYEPLHHKYRPQTFSDLVGQETIALTLSNALKQVKIAPAYLFTGPRGTGKTSSARILAKSLNCLSSSKPTPHPCGKCEVCLAIAKSSALDVMEIDAASNTGVDNIREIIERSRFAPVQCRYKIYVIDECHMLSTAAFNALLKTLEEPPPQVVFILATTDPQRVLSTIISRCQRFDYRRIPLSDMTAHLRFIADAEKIAIADDALTLIAQIANGGLRDAESLLDQLSLLPETISVARVWDLVGAVPEQDLLMLLQAINSNNSLAVLQQCRSLLDRGREPLVVLQNLANFYLNLLIAKTAPQRLDLTAVTETCWQQLCIEAAHWDTAVILRGQQQLRDAETQLKQTTQPRLWLEVTLLGLLPEVNTAIANQPVTVLNPVATRDNLKSTANAQSTQKINQPNNVSVNVATPEPIIAETTFTAQRLPESAALTEQNVEQDNATNIKAALKNTTPVRSVAASESLAEIPHNSQQDPVANQEIWSKVVSCLQPPTTQALLKQQCHLVSFDGESAIVGISSAKLQKLNQGKVSNIEAAFAKVCQSKVKVQLEVANLKDTLTKNMAAISNSAAEMPNPTVNINSTSSSTSKLKTSQPKAVEAQVKSTNSLSNPERVAQKFTPDLNPVNPVNPATKNNHIPSPDSDIAKITAAKQDTSVITSTILPKNNVIIPQTTGESLSQDYADNDLQQAIDKLTQSFEGEVVQLSNIPEESHQAPQRVEQLDTSYSSLDRPDIDDYDDEW